jgi:quercetin dioxygenase-like cupin family protein
VIFAGSPIGLSAVAAPLIKQPDQFVYQADGVFLRQIIIHKAGDTVPQHSHVHGHHTAVFGRVQAWRDGEDLGVFGDGRYMLYIPPNTFHHFQALEDRVMLICFHNLHGSEEPEILAEAALYLKE